MMGFQPPTCDRPRREAPRRFSASELYCSLAGTLAGRYPVRTTGVPVRFNSAWTRMLRAARTAVRGASSASRCPGPAYGVRKTAGLARTPERRRRSGDVNESEALVRISQERSSCGLIGNQRFPRHQKSPISGDDPSVASGLAATECNHTNTTMTSKSFGNQYGHRTPQAEVHVGFLPRLKAWVSVFQSL